MAWLGFATKNTGFGFGKDYILDLNSRFCCHRYSWKFPQRLVHNSRLVGLSGGRVVSVLAAVVANRCYIPANLSTP